MADEVTEDAALLVLRRYAVVPQSRAEQELASVIYDELTNLGMGFGVRLGPSAMNWDDGRRVLTIDGTLDLIALARRMLEVVPRLIERENRWQRPVQPKRRRL